MDAAQKQIITTVSSSLDTATKKLTESNSALMGAIEQTANSVTMFIGNVGQITIFGQSAKAAADEATENAKKGTKVMADLSASMGAIEQTEKHLNEIVKNLDLVTTKSKVINDIVFQSKLLSFNASMEAARAGAHGKAFGVVAQEVGKLAQTSGTAAIEIGDLLNTSRSHAVALIDTIAGRTKESKAVLDQALTAFTEIVGNIAQITDQLKGVYDAVKEQEGGANKTLAAVQRFGEIIEITENVKKSMSESVERLRNLEKS